MARQLTVGSDLISEDSDCYVVAEIGHNHQGNLETARELFRKAKECGADAVKLQKRDNRALYTKAWYDKSYEHEASFGRTYGEHRQALEFGWEEYSELKRYSRELGVTFFATAFDFKSADFLAKLEMPAFKIASADLTNIPLLKYVAHLKKPMFVSTGGASMEDVERSYEAIMPVNPQVCLMQCTSVYPADFNQLNLRVITSYREKFQDIVIGASMHDNGIAMALAARMLGAQVIEKHFTLNRAMKGADHAFSLEPIGLRKMVRDLRRLRPAIGDGVKKVYPDELDAISKMGKKMVASRDLSAGHVLKPEDIAIKSPGDALPPCRLDNIIGRKLRRSVKEDENILLEDISV